MCQHSIETNGKILLSGVVELEDKLWWVSSWFSLNCIALHDFDKMEPRLDSWVNRWSQAAELSDGVGDDEGDQDESNENEERGGRIDPLLVLIASRSSLTMFQNPMH